MLLIPYLKSIYQYRRLMMQRRQQRTRQLGSIQTNICCTAQKLTGPNICGKGSMLYDIIEKFSQIYNIK